jgi:hypothetical protein
MSSSSIDRVKERVCADMRKALQKYVGNSSEGWCCFAEKVSKDEEEDAYYHIDIMCHHPRQTLEGDDSKCSGFTLHLSASDDKNYCLVIDDGDTFHIWNDQDKRIFLAMLLLFKENVTLNSKKGTWMHVAYDYMCKETDILDGNSSHSFMNKDGVVTLEKFDSLLLEVDHAVHT